MNEKKFRKLLVELILDTKLKEDFDDLVDEFVEKVYPKKEKDEESRNEN
jgi:hypothetical protein